MEIYVQKDGQQTGPFSKEQIHTSIGSGELKPSDLAWHDGREAWSPLGSLVGIGLSPTAVPPPTDRIEGNPAANAAVANSDRLNSDPASAFGMEDGGDLGIAKTIGIFKSLDYGFLLPFRKVFSQGLLRKKAVRWVILFGVTPLVIEHAAAAFELNDVQTVGLIATYFCLFWALYFYSLITPGKEVWKRGLCYAAFTATVCLPVVFGLASLPVLKQLNDGASSDNGLIRLFGLIFGVGLVEETCKALPLLIFGLRKNKIASPNEGLFLGFMSGLGFAVTEAIQYVLAASQTNAGALLFQSVFRFMSGPLFHGAWAGVVGWFIGLAATQKQPRWPIIVVGITFMALLHGVNDFVADSIFQIPMAIFFIIVFMAYLVHGEKSSQSTGIA